MLIGFQGKVLTGGVGGGGGDALAGFAGRGAYDLRSKLMSHAAIELA